MERTAAAAEDVLTAIVDGVEFQLPGGLVGDAQKVLGIGEITAQGRAAGRHVIHINDPRVPGSR